MTQLKKTVCSCERCQAACRRTPGWFRPGEAEKAAELLGLPLKKFFRRYLGVNWYCNDDGSDTFVLAPAIHGMTPGTEYPSSPLGRCVFLTNEGQCQIHAAKPWHCSHGNPCTFNEDAHKRATARTVTLWNRNQKDIAVLLRRKPAARQTSIFEMMLGEIGW